MNKAPFLIRTFARLILGFSAAGCSLAAAGWQPASPQLLTRWGKEIRPETVWPEYPRPQLERTGWQNLNGLWDFALLPANAAPPTSFARTILVPFPVESALSGVGEKVTPEQTMWYHRIVTVKNRQSDKRVRLNFEAVDWEATIWVNGQSIGTHTGGYEPFSFDITDALGSGEQADIVVGVKDATGRGQPKGKQNLNPKNIWYTPTSGIWFTVWLEQVPAVHVVSVVADTWPTLDGINLVIGSSHPQEKSPVDVELLDPVGKSIARVSGESDRPLPIKIADPRLWTPASPALYGLKITLGGDVVTSYCGVRRVEMRKDAQGINRFFLNGEQTFLFGPLDQGFWPDGLYTPPTQEAMGYDLGLIKSLGFNMLRKHIKVEPRVYYSACDRLGLLVWQDFVSGDASETGVVNFKKEGLAMIEELKAFPSIVAWIVFNEGWGQSADPKETITATITAAVRAADPSRLVSSVTGWHDRGTGDMVDRHDYSRASMPPLESGRASVLGEFGGVGLLIPEHSWKVEKIMQYGGGAKTREDYFTRFTDAMLQVAALVPQGLAAAVYTQTTDVEGEINGVVTYDREIVKLPVEASAKIIRRIIQTKDALRTLLPTAKEKPGVWRYTTTQPAEGWTSPAFDDRAWQEGVAGFGAHLLPKEAKRAEMGTVWETPDIWLRRTFDYDGAPLLQPLFKIFHDEDAEVYLNGKLVVKAPGYNHDYAYVLPGESLDLKRGANVLTVHCHQVTGGQYIDVGLFDFSP